MNLADEKQRNRLSVAPLRIPQWIRDRAKEISKDQSTDTVRVSETDVYRSIITNFFSQDRLQNVDDNSLSENEAAPEKVSS